MSDFELTDHIATKDEINQATDRSRRVVELAAAYQLLETDSEKIFMLNLAGGFTATLPAIADAGAGWRCKFVVKTAPTTAYIISEKAADDTDVVIVRGMVSIAATAGVESGGCTAINLVANQAVAGDWIDIVCDGTNFYANGLTSVAAGATVT